MLCQKDLSSREKRVLAYIAGRCPIVRDPQLDVAASITLGQRAEDQIGCWGGSRAARAKARSKKLGRAYELTPHQQQEAKRRRRAGETIAVIAKSYADHHSTISRLYA